MKRINGAQRGLWKEYVPQETFIQQAFIEWCEVESHRIPELKLIYAVPNGGYRHPATAAKMKREGQKPGVPDLCLPVPRKGYASLYIELKRGKSARVSDAQKWWKEQLSNQGNLVQICRSYEEAVDAITAYLA